MSSALNLSASTFHSSSNAVVEVEHMRKSLTETMTSLIELFQKKAGKWITSNCQHIQEGNTHYYGIHKNQQFQRMGSFESSIMATRKLYQEMKSHLLQKMGLPPSTAVIQVVGDSAAFSAEGTKKAMDFLRKHISTECVIVYGFTGHAESDGTRCVNAAVTDLISEKSMQKQTIANLVGFHTPIVLTSKEWGCTGPDNLSHYVIVYGDDESSRQTGTVFGDDVTTSDYFSDSLLMLDGGAQSFRQACNALLLGQKITILAGLRTMKRRFKHEPLKEEEKNGSVNTSPNTVMTPYFAAANFLQEVILLIRQKGEAELQNWYKDYFGLKKCYVADTSKGDYDTKQQLLDDAWNLFISKKLYRNIQTLVSYHQDDDKMKEMKITTSQGDVSIWDNNFAGDTVVFLHGNTSCKEAFKKQAEEFGRSYRIIAIDFPGHGKSDKSNSPDATYTYIGYAKVVNEVLKNIEASPSVLVGWSLGGHVAIELVNKQNLFHLPSVKGVLITGTPPCSLESLETRRKGFNPIPEIMNLITKIELDDKDARKFVELSGIDANDEPYLIEAAMKTDGYARQRLQQWKAEPGSKHIDQKKTVLESDIPFAVVAGKDDNGINTPYIVNEVKFGSLWQNKVHLIENSGHAPFWQQATEFNLLLSLFIKSVTCQKIFDKAVHCFSTDINLT